LEAASWGFIGTLVGAVVGASASVLTTAINNWNSSRLQQIAKSHDRAELSRAFQRETLLATQDALQCFIRLIARSHLADLEAHRATGSWGKNMLPEDLSEGVRMANQKLTALIVRIADDSLRLELAALCDGINAVLLTRSREEAESIFNSLTSVFGRAMVNLGSILRNTY